MLRRTSKQQRRRNLRTQLQAERLESRCVMSATVFEHSNIGYFVDNEAPRLQRYDIANETWLSPTTLVGAADAPTAALVDDDGIYAAFGKAVYRYNLDGTGQTHLINLQYNIIALHSENNLLFLNNSNGLYARFVSINKTNNAVIDDFENYVEAVGGSSISPQTNRILGRSIGISPADITYVSYNDAGTFIAGGDSPYHGDYPDANRTWVFGNGAKVVDSSGTVYATNNLTRLGSFATAIQALDVTDGGVPVVLNGQKVTAYTANYLPTGSATLTGTPSEIFVNDNSVIAFSVSASSETGFEAQIVPLENLDPPTPGEPVDPVDLSYKPDKIEVAANGQVLLLSKANMSIFRWDPQTQSYGDTIPLIGSPEYMAYSAANNMAYVAYSSGLIYKIDLSAAQPAEVPFASLATGPMGLSTAGQYVFAADGSGAWGTHYTFAPDGAQIDAVDWNYYSSEYVWNDANQKMYFFRDDTSPNDLLWEEINANGTAYLSQPPGGIGGKQDSPLHDSAGFSHPIRVAPDGSIVVLGSGVIHNAKTLARLTGGLANSITDAAWLGSELYTVRNIAGVTQYQHWSQPTYGQDDVLQTSGTALALLSLSSTELLGIGRDAAGVPTFAVLDANLDVQDIQNSAPVLDNSGSPALNPVAEDAINPGGTLVSALIAGAVSDPDAGATQGIAVIGAYNTFGQWQYSTNSGASWQAMGNVSPSAARLLPSNSQTRIRFLPNSNFNGTVKIFYRAWDRTEGVAGGTIDLTDKLGGEHAFSLAYENASQRVTPVNDAPVLDTTADPTLDPVWEDAKSPAGTLVQNFASGAISDVDRNAVKGIAVTSLDSENGRWQFSLNGGTSWQDFGVVAEGSARLLPVDALAKVRFIPNPNFDNQVSLTFRAWDRTAGTAGGTLSTFSRTGGNGTFSSAFDIATLTMVARNDKPVLSVGGPVGYVHDAAAVTLAPWGKVHDVDSPDFDGGFLRVHIADGAGTSNRLLIGGEFTIDANNNVLLGSAVIGKREANGWGTNDLLITFNPAATRVIVQQLVRAIAFKTVGGSAGTRGVQFSLSDGDGGLSEVVEKAVNVT